MRGFSRSLEVESSNASGVMWAMEEEMFVAVRRTEHVEVTSRAVEVAPAAAAGPRTVRVFCDDYDATDSSGDEDDEEAAAAARRRVKRYVQEIRLERAVKEAPAAKAAASSAAAAAAAASPTSVLRSFPPSAVAEDTCGKKPAPAAQPAYRAPETDESSVDGSVFGCPFTGDDCFGGEFPPLYTDFDLLADFPEPSLDFLADLPEEPLSLPSMSAGTSAAGESSPEPASPAGWLQVDDFFQDITDLFQIDPLPVV